MKRLGTLAAAAFFAFAAFGAHPLLAEETPTDEQSTSENQARDARIKNLTTLVVLTFDLIERNYYYDVDIEKCAYDILKALSGGTLPYDENQARDTDEEEFVCLDKYSRFMTPDEAKTRRQQIEGRFTGIGIRIFEKNGNVVVDSSFDGSPALAAGIKQGDVILKVRSGEDKPLETVRNMEHAVSLIIGPAGTKVEIIVLRGGTEITLPEITRARVDVPSVKHETLPGGVGYAKIDSFAERTGDELEAALAGYEDLPQPRVIIDVRDNPGGALASVLETLFYFSGNGNDVVLTELYREDIGAKEETIGALSSSCGQNNDQSCFVNPETDALKRPGRFAHYRVVVLANKRSASASEIFAGTLKDWGGALRNFVVVGEPTHEKGVMQTVMPIFPLSFGSSPYLSLTTAELCVGNARNCYHGEGITPNFNIPDSREKPGDTLTRRDSQFLGALRIWGIENDPAVEAWLDERENR